MQSERVAPTFPWEKSRGSPIAPRLLLGRVLASVPSRLNGHPTDIATETFRQMQFTLSVAAAVLSGLAEDGELDTGRYTVDQSQSADHCSH
jgi:hypothetical protein